MFKINKTVDRENAEKNKNEDNCDKNDTTDEKCFRFFFGPHFILLMTALAYAVISCTH